LTAKFLAQTGVQAEALRQTTHALINRIVNLQATMLAYNDVSWYFGILFLFVVPLVLLLPRQAAAKAKHRSPAPGRK
jgi:MFS transporter, DHA2 family, multidrug resistance protein